MWDVASKEGKVHLWRTFLALLPCACRGVHLTYALPLPCCSGVARFEQYCADNKVPLSFEVGAAQPGPGGASLPYCVGS